MADKPQVLCFEGNGRVKLNKVAIERLLQSEGFKRQLEAVREIERELHQQRTFP